MADLGTSTWPDIDMSLCPVVRVAQRSKVDPETRCAGSIRAFTRVLAGCF
jgi:hypothetical protein